MQACGDTHSRLIAIIVIIVLNFSKEITNFIESEATC